MSSTRLGRSQGRCWRRRSRLSGRKEMRPGCVSGPATRPAGDRRRGALCGDAEAAPSSRSRRPTPPSWRCRTSSTPGTAALDVHGDPSTPARSHDDLGPVLIDLGQERQLLVAHLHDSLGDGMIAGYSRKSNRSPQTRRLLSAVPANQVGQRVLRSYPRVRSASRLTSTATDPPPAETNPRPSSHEREAHHSGNDSG